jgi:hypothetical protein
MFENRLLGLIFWLKGEEGTRGWREFYNEVLHKLHCSVNIVSLTKSGGSKEGHGMDLRE